MDGRVFAFGWACARPPDVRALVREDGDRLIIIPLDTLTRDRALTQESPRGFETNAIRMDVSLLSGGVRVAVPILSVEQFYYAHQGDGWAFGNDLRLMVDWAGFRLHGLAAHLMFMCDYVPPPYTLSETVRRVRPGHVFTVWGDGTTSERRFFRGADLAAPPDDAEPVECVRRALDSVLANVGRPVAVHFSGGVDSGLIAARLATLSRDDVRLHNFTTGPASDPFYDLARDMADHLGLPCDRVVWDAAALPEMLEAVAREFAVPVPDPATLPTLALVRNAEQRGEKPATVVTGTGAGNFFDSASRLALWRRVYAIPRPLRELGALAYRLGFWQRRGTAARIASTLQRSTLYTVIQNAAFLQGTTLGLAFDMAPDALAAIQTALAEAQIAPLEGMSAADQVAMVAMLRHGHTCGARPFDPLRRRGVAPVHVFMEPAVIRVAFSIPWDVKRSDGEGKALLKALLAESVPREWVYRKRQGFLTPFRDVFTHPRVRQMVGDVVLSRGNPAVAFCRPEGVRQIFARALAGKPLHVGTERFVWVLTTLSLWLDQVKAPLLASR